MLVTKHSDQVLSAQITCEGGLFTFIGKMRTGKHQGVKVIYQAPEPSDLRQSVNGSALPYPNPQMAFGVVNTGIVIPDKEGDFSFQVMMPNSYYLDDDIMNGVGQGKILVKPHIKLNLTLGDGSEKKYNFDIGSHAMFLRSLTNYPGKFIRSTGRNTPSHFAAPTFN